MSSALCTYCSAAKRRDPKPLPAIERYQSTRIERLHKQAEDRGLDFFILSGEYGLLAPSEPIPFYDHLLLPEEVAAMVQHVADQIAAKSIVHIDYFTVDPRLDPNVSAYLSVIQTAAQQTDCRVSVQFLDGIQP